MQKNNNFTPSLYRLQCTRPTYDEQQQETHGIY